MDRKRTLLQQFIYINALMHRVGGIHHRGMGGGANPQRGQGRVLAILKLQPEITQKELGYLLDMRNQSLGELLGKLEKKGYITRSKSEEDKRTTNISLTDAGMEAAGETERQQDEWESLFSGLTDEEKNQLYELLEKLGQSLLEQVGGEDGYWGLRGFGMFGGFPGFGREGHPDRGRPDCGRPDRGGISRMRPDPRFDSYGDEPPGTRGQGDEES